MQHLLSYFFLLGRRKIEKKNVLGSVWTVFFLHWLLSTKWMFFFKQVCNIFPIFFFFFIWQKENRKNSRSWCVKDVFVHLYYKVNEISQVNTVTVKNGASSLSRTSSHNGFIYLYIYCFFCVYVIFFHTIWVLFNFLYSSIIVC